MPDAKPAQAFVPVREVRNGIVILKDGGYRSILMCSSLNFALKSEEEQRAIIGGFQNFLNTLDFSIEVVVHSRRMDIRPYIVRLNERSDAQTSELMRIQLREYIKFIENFIAGTDVMSKLFYVVVPYSPTLKMSSSGGFSLFNKSSDGVKVEGDTSFEESRIQLEQRVALVANGIASTGLQAVPLGTEEVIELLYRSFNVGELETPIHLEK